LIHITRKDNLDGSGEERRPEEGRKIEGEKEREGERRNKKYVNLNKW